MIHVLIAKSRTDDPRGGEVVADPSGSNIENTGVLIYMDSIVGMCTMMPISADRLLGSGIAHELGHALQLGHDTETGGGINYYNIMSVPDACLDAYRRFFGTDNTDPQLGATQAAGASRFSAAAVGLMDLDDILSVDTYRTVNGGLGREM